MKTAIFRSFILRGLSIGLAASFCSCASVQRQATPSQPDRPSVGKGLVTFYRERRFVGMAVGFNVRGNGQKIGGLPNGTYFVYQAAPGMHRFTAATETTSVVNLNVQPGQIYYVRGDLEMGFAVGRPRLTVVTPETGASAIGGLRRVTLRPE